MSGSSRDLARRLNAATIHLTRALRQDDATAGLGAEHRSALAAVVLGGPLPIGDLARREQLGAPGMTKTVRALEHAGLVRRERDAADARVVRVAPTREGKELILRGRDERVARIVKALGTLTKSEIARFEITVAGLERLIAELERTPARSAHRDDRHPRRSAT